MISRILVGYDGSDSSNDALELAADLASHYVAELHVLAVARPPEFGDEVETRAVTEQSQHHLNKVLSQARSRLVTNKAKQHFHVLVGHPAEQIVRYAEEHAIDHIVVGRRGHTVFERWLIVRSRVRWSHTPAAP